MQIKIWHCYFYGRQDTTIILAENEPALRAKVRDVIASEWDWENQGPMPESFADLFEAFHDYDNQQYFGDWDWAYINPALCATGEETV